MSFNETLKNARTENDECDTSCIAHVCVVSESFVQETRGHEFSRGWLRIQVEARKTQQDSLSKTSSL